MKKSTKLTLEVIGLVILGFILGVISGISIFMNAYKDTEPIDMTPINDDLPVTEASVLPAPQHDPDPGKCQVDIPEEPAEKTVVWEYDVPSSNVTDLSAANGTVYVSNQSQTYSTVVCQFSGDVKFDSFESVSELCRAAYVIEVLAPGESRKVEFDNFSNADVYTTMIIENFNEDPEQPELSGSESLAAFFTYSFN